ncbi:MAG: hypothetical protein KAT00_15240 [Planctomycetes bacterium]|nr:hypothetical protein [Planctomycetota bacterium]
MSQVCQVKSKKQLLARLDDIFRQVKRGYITDVQAKILVMDLLSSTMGDLLDKVYGGEN